MRISGLTLTDTSEGLSELSAEVRVLKPRPETYRVWFRGPQGCFGEAPLGDIYFAAFWIPAMFLHEEFIIEGEVSKELLDAAYGRLEPLFLEWHPHDLVAAPIQGHQIIESVTPPSSGRGCLYSGGVDSYYSIAKHVDSITHLVFIQGFEIQWRRDDLFRDALTLLREGALALNRDVIVLRTNIQDPITDLTMRSAELGRHSPGFMMIYYFGSMLVSLSLCLRGILGETLIPSSWSAASSKIMGSHPQIEPNWSTSTMSFELDGCEADRIEKLGFLAKSRPECFRWLRVCTVPEGNGVINCGRCGKCLRTMMEMRIAGAGETACLNFDHPLDLNRAKRHIFSRDGGLMQDLLRRAREAGDEEMVKTVEIILGKRFYWPRVQANLYRWGKEWRRGRHRRKRIRRKARHA